MDRCDSTKFCADNKWYVSPEERRQHSEFFYVAIRTANPLDESKSFVSTILSCLCASVLVSNMFGFVYMHILLFASSYVTHILPNSLSNCHTSCIEPTSLTPWRRQNVTQWLACGTKEQICVLRSTNLSPGIFYLFSRYEDRWHH